MQSKLLEGRKFYVVLLAVLLLGGGASAGYWMGAQAAPPSGNSIIAGDASFTGRIWGGHLRDGSLTAGELVFPSTANLDFTGDTDLVWLTATSTLGHGTLNVNASTVTATTVSAGSVTTDALSVSGKNWSETEADYIVWVDAGTYYAKNGHTGTVTSNVDAETLIESVIDSNRHICFKPGLFLFDGDITITSKDNLIFTGSIGTIFRKNSGSGRIISFTTSNYCTVDSIEFDGNNRSVSANNQVYVYDCDYFTFKNNIVENSDDDVYLFSIYNSIFTRILNNKFKTGQYGVDLDGGASLLQWDSLIQGNFFIDIKQEAIKIRGCKRCSVNNNFIDCGNISWGTNAGAGIRCYGADYPNLDVDISYNFITNSVVGFTGTGITVDVDASSGDTTYDINISYNNIQNMYYGIYNQRKRVSIIGNTIKVISSRPINLVNNADNNLIMMNKITSYYGIQIQSGCDNNIIFNNYLTCTDPLTDAGASNRIRNNWGYTTEQAGSATINNGSTSVVVSHACSYTPNARDISVIPTELSTNDPGQFYITNITSTQFTINCRNDPGASNLDISWSVRRTP